MLKYEKDIISSVENPKNNSDADSIYDALQMRFMVELYFYENNVASVKFNNYEKYFKFHAKGDDYALKMTSCKDSDFEIF